MKGISLLAFILFSACASRVEKPVATIDSKDFEFKQCFYESESYSLRQAGQVTIGFKVLPDGQVDDEKIVASDYKDANFHACLLHTARLLKFPKKDLETSVTKILNFTTKIKMNY